MIQNLVVFKQRKNATRKLPLEVVTRASGIFFLTYTGILRDEKTNVTNSSSPTPAIKIDSKYDDCAWNSPLSCLCFF